MSKQVTIVSVLVLVAVLGYAYVALKGQSKELLGYVTVTGLNSSSTLTSSPTLVLADKSGVQMRVITNIGTSTAYLSFNSTSTGFTAYTGLALLPSTTYEMTEAKGNLWVGNIWGVAPAGAPLIVILQK